MTIVPLIRAEFARLTASKLGIASLIALMTVPLFYGGLYLWGNHDPYSNLKNIPAAVVVADTGTTVDGKTTNYGEKTATSLLKDKKFDWVEVSAKQARAGVKKGTYDFSVSFPADFSTKLASAAGDNPSAARIDLTTDDTNSYLSTTIAKQATEMVRVEIAKQVGAKASLTLLDSIGDIRDGLVKADDGATKLSDGAATAASGANSLASGNAQLASGAATLSSGLAQLDAKASGLPANTQKLSAGASALSSGLQAAVTPGPKSVAALQSGAAQLAAAAPSATEQAEIIGALTLAGASPQEIAQVNAQLSGIRDGSAQLSSSITTDLVPSVTAAASGAAQVAAGAAALNSAAPTLASAVHSAATGAASLSTGAAQASSGASDLSGGVNQLASGSSELSSSLGDAVQKIPTMSGADRTTASNLIADPLSVKQDAITEAADYGAGLAPFFLSLASWIGIYALFLIVRPLSRRALTAVRRPIRTMLAGWLTPAILGVIQMVALFAVVTLALGLPVANPVGLVAFMAFVALSFAAIVLALNVLLGSVGQFLALIFMVVQLVVAGGTFPWQTLPGPLRALHQALPMSHAVDGIRQLMYGGLSSDVWQAILPLLFWLVGSLLVAALGARRQGKFRTLRELRPSAIGG
ncbi:YhgE/Pip domain-containing protein [Lacisediminihabitans changchengi]|uniref:YhgE/Pip domain-containing protein n=1 Tax=Lacisediminihabitans changchengi TaxID=2787634 RepID=A0A934STD0_9MICO|nr:YhgE/Pip domain-containing protein [Lacisediminihabitans changchengi]MBK4348590.1 YhgE/Pip domain-containing protein [Lacisediminihabitans changchengi]